jgi:A118 family predicted phage portal protein
MPLPSGGVWPPKELQPVTARLAVWSAWYTGDTDMLSDIYGGNLAGDPGVPLGGFLNPDRPGLRGVIGRTLARWFWGIPNPSGEKRTKLHLPVASDIASVSADMLFSEPPTLTMPDKADDKTKARLAELAGDEMQATLLEGMETAAGLGGVYLKVCWDKALDSKPWLASVHADAAIPTFMYGRLVAVTFWRHVFEDGSRIVRHLERHEPGVILHGLYDGSRGDLGKQIPLDAYPETAGLDSRVETKIDMLTADYVPNIRPARVWRNQPAGAYLGRADFSGAEPFMDSLDEIYSDWMRDIRQAKGRLIVEEQALENLGRGSGSRFDPDREVYEAIAGLSRPGEAPITQVQFQIRVAEHMQSAQHWMDKIVQMSGYSTQTFGEQGNEGAAAMTATEIKAREKRTNTTRDKKIMYVRPPLARIIEAMLAIDRNQFGSGVEPDQPDIQFGDTVSEDSLTLAQTAQALRAAEAASDETLVQLVNPEWDDKQVQAEVAKIKAERPTFPDVSDPFGGMGSGGSDTPPDQPGRAAAEAFGTAYGG